MITYWRYSHRITYTTLWKFIEAYQRVGLMRIAAEVYSPVIFKVVIFLANR